ncbi:MAG: 16S/23S rRNA (cytidine-2'-O)-methyltransferase, partial [Deltaproteobacteria bacterium]|nr:16S/23S rRNA (cytidine-2'-O)-methyltransferase [Deltaproteobacteria bacterium]
SGLIDWRLRQDPRVTVVEKTNARYLTAEQVGCNFDLAVIDVSFISLNLILPSVINLVKPGGDLLAMVKPQFEVGKENVGRGGVVRDPETQKTAVEAVAKNALVLNLEVLGVAPARIKGPKGNQEFFLWLRVRSENGADHGDHQMVDEIIPGSSDRELDRN